MSDLYHPKVPFEFIAAVHGVAAACPQHQFLILTKRPERMLEFYRWVHKLGLEPATGGAIDVCCSEAVSMFDVCKHDGYIARLVRASERCNWPLPNVVVGVSAETKAALERRWFYLEHLPPAVRWVSLEPLLGPVDLWCCLPEYNDHHLHVRGVDWVVVGAESGPGARPCKLEWVESLVHQCDQAGVKIHIKQIDIDGRVSHDIAEWPGWARRRDW
jgi:protein gp37